jgi:hypothetical protein
MRVCPQRHMEARVPIERRFKAAESRGLHRTYCSDAERGVRNVSLVNNEKIAKGLSKSLPELFNRV